MTKKDYEAIAGAIKDVLHYPAVEAKLALRDGVELTTLRIAEILAGDNSRFDKDRFFRACGLAEIHALDDCEGCSFCNPECTCGN